MIYPHRKPSLPHGVRLYVFGDLHGRSDLLAAMFKVVDADLRSLGNRRRVIHVFLGDYIDRGPDSAGTIDLLLRRSQSHETVFLKGNHEDLLLRALIDPTYISDWKKLGGTATLTSYGMPRDDALSPSRPGIAQSFLNRAIPPQHKRFMQRLFPFFQWGDFFFVHAGIRPGVPLAQQREHDLLWIRHEFLASDEQFEKYIVHGHTPVAKPDIRHNRVNIDTGAYATGNLTLMSIQGSRMLAVCDERKKHAI